MKSPRLSKKSTRRTTSHMYKSSRLIEKKKTQKDDDFHRTRKDPRSLPRSERLWNIAMAQEHPRRMMYFRITSQHRRRKLYVPASNGFSMLQPMLEEKGRRRPGRIGRRLPRDTTNVNTTIVTVVKPRSDTPHHDIPPSFPDTQHHDRTTLRCGFISDMQREQFRDAHSLERFYHIHVKCLYHLAWSD